jgi:protein-tyrosine-phosphatase
MLNDKDRHDVKAASAGVSAIDGFSPTDETVKVMKSHDVDVSKKKTAKLTAEMIKKADLVLTMENLHTIEVMGLVPEAKDRTFLLKEYTGRKDKTLGFSVPDPIGRPMEVYERVAGTIKECVKELVKKI